MGVYAEIVSEKNPHNYIMLWEDFDERMIALLRKRGLDKGAESLEERLKRQTSVTCIFASDTSDELEDLLDKGRLTAIVYGGIEDPISISIRENGGNISRAFVKEHPNARGIAEAFHLNLDKPEDPLTSTHQRYIFR